MMEHAMSDTVVPDSSRRRVLAALNHEQPDRVPIDLGGTFVTGLHCSCVEELRRHFGLPDEPIKVHEPYQMLGHVDEDLKQALGVDVEGVIPNNTIFGFPAQNWKPWRAPWGQDVLVPEQFNATTTDAGDVYMYPQGDTTAPPSGHMPQGSFFFDAVIRQEPFNEEDLHVADNLEEFTPLDEANFQRLVEGVEAAAKTGRAVVVCTPGTALGDIALVPAPGLKHPKGIRDVAEWYMSTAMRPDYVKAIFEHQVNVAIPNLQRINDAVGELIDVVVLCGTDFGTQQSQFCSEATFRELWLPYYRRLNDYVHENTKWKTFKHSCGAVLPLIDAFLDSGFDILNPVQCSATDMDPPTLKARFGDRLTFWGGGVDTQHTLPFGTPDQVRQQVLERCEVFARGGGYVFNAIHNIQAQTPVANIIAMLDAVHTFNGQQAPA
jgi:uroporphyrinogen-III decarboxylase